MVGRLDFPIELLDNRGSPYRPVLQARLPKWTGQIRWHQGGQCRSRSRPWRPPHVRECKLKPQKREPSVLLGIANRQSMAIFPRWITPDHCSASNLRPVMRTHARWYPWWPGAQTAPIRGRVHWCKTAKPPDRRNLLRRTAGPYI